MTSCLLLTADPILHAELDALVAAAGLAVVHPVDPAAALVAWPEATVVLVGLDQLEVVAALAPPRRERVHVVSGKGAPDSVYRSAVAIGAVNVIDLRQSSEWLAEELTGLADPGSRVGFVVGVVGGSGGAGSSTLAAALGQMAGRGGEQALVVDADPLGPGLDRLLGLDEVPGVRWDALHTTTGRLSSAALRDSVPRRAGCGVLTWPVGSAGSLQAFAAREALDAGRRGHDVVAVDLPRRADAVVAELMARCDALVILARPSLAGVASAAALLRNIEGRRAGLVLRSAPRGIDETEVAAALRLPLWATMADQRGLDEAVDLGRGPAGARGPLARTAKELLASWRAR